MADEVQPGQEPDLAAQLAAERAERERLAAEVARERQEREAIGQRSEQERAQMIAWAQGLQAQIAQSHQPQQPQQPQEDLDSVITRRDAAGMLAQAQQNWMNQVGQTMARQTLAQLQAQRMTNKRLAASDTSMPYFGRFIGEIDTILNSVDATIAAQENAYRQTYEIVKARHFDELMAEERQRWSKDEGDFEPEVERPQAQTQNPRAPVMPTSAAGTPARGASRRARREPIDAFEQSAIQRHFNGDVNAYEKALAGQDDDEDVLDMKGRRRV